MYDGSSSIIPSTYSKGPIFKAKLYLRKIPQHSIK